jgi:ethanolamine utilization protein EutQ (cupin superfamily)
VDNSPSRVRAFDTERNEGRTLQFGERQVFITPGVEQSEGGPLSAYSAHFGRGERADLPAPYEEVWVLLRGRLRIRGGDADVTVSAGEYLHVPEDSPGEVEALEDTTLVCVSVPAH